MYGCRNIIVRFCFDLYKFVMRVIKYGEWFGIKYEIIFVFYFFLLVIYFYVYEKYWSFFFEWCIDEKIYLLYRCSKCNEVLNFVIFWKW